MKDNVQSTDGYQQLSPYRRTLFKALKQVDPDTYLRIIAFYELKNFNFQSIWDVVLKLEINSSLDSTPGKIRNFAKCLEQRAQNVLLNRGAMISLNFNSETNLSLLNECAESFGQESGLDQSFSLSSVKCNGVGITDPNSSLFFRLQTNKRKALKKLMKMHLSDKLIEGLADILNTKRRKFSKNWKTYIDLEKYKEALKELKHKDYTAGQESNHGNLRAISSNSCKERRFCQWQQTAKCSEAPFQINGQTERVEYGSC
ncbi:uncharacterized protein [Antedon mediterranea]|uniref:uncharacterized protein n=1 Tax=Antedon mediterranea TaxID=105859 RepID=UPI003AF5CF07